MKLFFIGTTRLWQLLNCFPSFFLEPAITLDPSHYLYCYHPGQSHSRLSSYCKNLMKISLLLPFPSSACSQHSSLSEHSKRSHFLSLLCLKPCPGSCLLTVKIEILTKPFLIYLHLPLLQHPVLFLFPHSLPASRPPCCSLNPSSGLVP